MSPPPAAPAPDPGPAGTRGGDGLAPIPLRGHHLLCILTYRGHGYSPAFVAAMDAIVGRIRAGHPIVLVEGPDAICAAHVADTAEPHCHGEGVAIRDRRARADLATRLGLVLAPGDPVPPHPGWVEAARAAFRSGEVRSACVGCEWFDLCTGIAEGFDGMSAS